MPTYTYKCFNKEQKCNHEFEIKQSMKDDKLTHCDKCNSETLERVLQPTQVIYKSNGWFSKNGSY